MKTVLISGAEVKDRYLGNRGAEQLLRTVSSRLRSMGIQPAVVWGQVDSSIVAELGLAEYVGNPRTQPVDRWMPKFKLNRFVSLRGLDGVLDASGFALGDAWGIHTASWLERKYRQWNSLGIPIIALPQAYGPFMNPGMREKAENALNFCSRVFPRDSVSYHHVQSLGLTANVGSVTPDITIGETFDRPTFRHKRLVLVPNWNLHERGSSARYIDVLEATVQHAVRRGYEVVGVLHEGERDLKVLNSLPSRHQIRIEASLTGWETKKFIAASELVVSGRYHAVLAALTTATPVVTHSWSHKYREALELFGAEHWLSDPFNPEEVPKAIDRVLEGDSSERLESGKFEAVTRVEIMWQEIARSFNVDKSDITKNEQ